MPMILAVQPDPAQATELRRVLEEWTNADLTLVSSIEEALTAIDQRVPDLVLLHAFLPPSQEEDLVGYVRTLTDAQHVQALGIPLLERPGSTAPRPLPRPTGRRRSWPSPVGCDPRVFAGDVAAYLWRADAIRREIERLKPAERPPRERRGARRWLPPEVPWVSAARLATDRVELLNLSAGGALFATTIRPYPRSPSAGDPALGPRPSLTLTLASGESIYATGRIMRCRTRPAESGRRLYEVAFRFDASVGLYVPTDLALTTTGDPSSTSLLPMPGADAVDD